MATLSEAHRQWVSRPADERFYSVEDLHNEAVKARKLAAISDKVPTDKIRIEAHRGDLKLMAKNDMEIDMTNWAFSQMSNLAGAPAPYMQKLPAELAAQCLTHGLRNSGNRDNAMLFRRDEHTGMATLRALTSPKYSRIWNTDITSRLLELESQGVWQPAPAAFDGSRGLYMGDRDMFAFMVDNDRRIFESLPGGGLSRGFFVSNSEVGAATFKIKSFKYNYICGNHYVWGAEKIHEVSIRHIGNASQKAFNDELYAELKTYAESSAKEEELEIERMMTYKIGNDLEEILDIVLKLKIPGLTKKTVTEGYELAVQREDWYGAPNTVWGLAGGLTEIARDLPNADERLAMETATGKFCEIAF